MLFGRHEFGDLAVTPGIDDGNPVQIQMTAHHESGLELQAWRSFSEADVRRLIDVLHEAIER